MLIRTELINFINKRKKAIDREPFTLFKRSDNLVDSIFAILFSSKFLRRPSSVAYKNMYRKLYSDPITKRVNAGLPIQITMLGAPFKNQSPVKNSTRTLPDLAEVGFILHMYSLHIAIKTIYKPGIELILIHDGIYYAEPCNISIEDAVEYRKYFKKILDEFSDFSFIVPYELTDLLKKINVDEKEYSIQISSLAKEWMESSDAKHEVATAYKRAINSICPDKAIRERYINAMEEYRGHGLVQDMYIHTLILNSVYLYKKKKILIYDLRDPRKELFGDAIHATNLSDLENKIPLRIIHRGKLLLPWHGVGVVYKDNSFGVEQEEYIHHSNSFYPVYLENEDSPFFYSEIPEENLISDMYSKL